MLLYTTIVLTILASACAVFCYRLGLRDGGERLKNGKPTDAGRYRDLLLNIDRYNGTGQNQKKIPR